MYPKFPAFAAIVSACLFISASLAQRAPQTDSGEIFLGPRNIFESKRLKPGLTIEAFTQNGSVESDNPDGPWSRASLFAHGSLVRDADGRILKEVVFLETADAAGDLCWMVLWKPDGAKSNGSLELIQGMGKHAGISGAGAAQPEAAPRADGFERLAYSFSWNVDPSSPPFADEVPNQDQYAYKDECLSFHGPHKFLHSRALDNGTTLDFSTQSGVLMSRLGPETTSPRNNATCFDRGNTVKLNGKTQGDVMLLEDTDPDGDVVWLYHIWWYNRGPGIYKFIGGIGKWEGIQGAGVTKGMYKKRTDDHFMLNSELFWNIKPGH